MSTKSKPKINIRPIRKEDVEILNEIRRMPGVKETITGISSKRINQSEHWFNSLTTNDHVLVAVVEESRNNPVIGCVSLHIKHSPRMRHVAGLGIMVSAEYQGLGIGRSLMESVLDLADNWLNIVRVELSVAVGNDKAVKLYQSLGFSIEGLEKCAVYTNGKFHDLYKMARIRNSATLNNSFDTGFCRGG